MSTLGPLQKLRRTLVASGAFTRISTLPVLSTLGKSAPQTFVSAGWKSPGSCAKQKLVSNNINIRKHRITDLLAANEIELSHGAQTQFRSEERRVGKGEDIEGRRRN